MQRVAGARDRVDLSVSAPVGCRKPGAPVSGETQSRSKPSRAEMAA